MGKGDIKTKRGKIIRGTYGKKRKRKKKNIQLWKKNRHCYVSKQPLTQENKSLEHVIPNALGGKLKSYWLLNNEWNSKFGETIDKALIEQIPLSTLISIKRDRGQNPKITAFNEKDEKFLIGENKYISKGFKKPETKLIDENKELIKFVKGQEDQILKAKKKKNPNLDIEKLKSQINWTINNEEISLFFSPPLSPVSGSDAFRAICKIATNYYVLKTNDTLQIQKAISFIKSEIPWLNKIKYFYPKDKVIHNLCTHEISHLILVKGIQNEKLLYAYIELFSCYNFLIILNDNYTGKDIEYSYCYDLFKSTELKKTIDLNLTKLEIANMKFPQDENTESEFFAKTERVLNIKGFKVINKKKPAANIAYT